MPEHPNVRRLLDLSTAHIEPRTRAEWELAPPTHVHPTEYGYFVWAGDNEHDETDEGWPPEVTACRRFARSLGCGYLLFDADADTVEELVVFYDD